MATIETSNTNWSKSSTMRITYTAYNGYIQITGLEGKRNDNYESYLSSAYSLKINGTNCSLNNYVYFGQKTYKSFNPSSAFTVSGSGNTEITITLPTGNVSWSGCWFKVTINIPPPMGSFNLNVLNPDGSEPYSTGEAGTVQFSSDGGSSYSRIYNEPSGEYVQGTAFRAKNFEPGAHRYLSSTSGFNGGSGTDGDPWYATQGSSTTLNFYTAWNRYWNDVNVYNPNGVQDYASAYFDLYTSENDSHRYNLLNEDNDMTHVYGSYFEVSNIRPYYSYYELDHVDGYDSIPTTGTYRKIFDAANEVLGVYMRYKSYYRDINAFQPNGSTQAGLIFDYYIYNRNGTLVNSYTNVTNEVSGTVTREYGFTGKINNIRTNVTGAHYTTNNITGTSANEFTWTFDNENAINLYSAWNTYTVVFNANGGTGTMANQGFTYNTAQNLNSNSYTRAGYTFLGWSTSDTATSATYSNNESVNNLTSVNGGTVILYAIWQLNTYTISYASNGGSSTPSSQTKTHGVNLTIAAAISHNNSVTDGYTVTFNANEGATTKSSETATDITSYTFTGWKSSATNTVWSGGATNFNENNVTTLTAQWTPTTTHGSVTLPTAAQCTRANYILLGFSTNSTATTATYQPGTSYTPTSNITLYAIWQTTTKQIDYKVNGVWKKGIVYIKTDEVWKLSYKQSGDTEDTIETYSNYNDLLTALNRDVVATDVTIDFVPNGWRQSENVFIKVNGVWKEVTY